MLRRRIGETDLDVAIVALGCWAMACDSESWGPVNDNESIAAIHKAIDLGINLIDTAPSYGDGHSEEIVGKAVADRRDRVLLATKCGVVPPGTGQGGTDRDLTPQSIRRECEASLRRLRTETIDLYQCHWPDPNTPMDQTMAAMIQLRDHGKIRAIGVSNFSCQQMSACRAVAPLDCAQPPLSMLDRKSAEDIIPYCQEHRIGVVVYSPLAKGLLTGKYNLQSVPSDFRSSDEDFQPDRLSRHLRTIEKLRPFAEQYQATLAQLAIAWAANYPGVTAAIVGAKRPSQVIENAAAAQLRISIQDLTAIDEILQAK
jgi:aryl-alcohol dehydrogenase-like predicted oxidoreductase